jgi:hypothetical protein
MQPRMIEHDPQKYCTERQLIQLEGLNLVVMLRRASMSAAWLGHLRTRS